MIVATTFTPLAAPAPFVSSVVSAVLVASFVLFMQT